jgi:hypothetical protein
LAFGYGHQLLEDLAEVSFSHAFGNNSWGRSITVRLTGEANNIDIATRGLCTQCNTSNKYKTSKSVA